MGDGTISAPVATVTKQLQVGKLSEFDLQTLVFEECATRALTNSDWEMVAAVPNGQYRPGQRMEAGLKRGYPDIFVALPRIRGNVHRHGLYLELKISPNKMDTYQLWWQRRLRIQGYVCECIWDDPQEVIKTLEWWIE